LYPIPIFCRHFSDIVGDGIICAIILNAWDLLDYVKGSVIQRVITG